MYLVYVDESGDTGLDNTKEYTNNTPTRYYILGALVVHESQWYQLLNDIIFFRRNLRENYGLKMREEIHVSQWFTKPKEISRIPKYQRLEMCRRIIDFEEKLSYIKLIHVVVDKKKINVPEYDVFENAWKHLIQRIDNTLYYRNFPYGFGKEEYALLLPDRTDDKKLRDLVRRMRHFNYVPFLGGGSSRPLNMRYIIEDPHMKDSLHSYIVQLVDVNTYFLHQKLKPNSYMRKKKGDNYFMRLDNVLLKQASQKCKWGKGIVWIP